MENVALFNRWDFIETRIGQWVVVHAAPLRAGEVSKQY